MQRLSLKVLTESLVTCDHRSCCQRNCSGLEDFGSGSTRGCSIHQWPCGSPCHAGFSQGCHGRLCNADPGGQAGPGCPGGCRQSAEISSGKLGLEQLQELSNTQRIYSKSAFSKERKGQKIRLLGMFSFLFLSTALRQLQRAYVKQCRWYKGWYFSHLLEKYTKMQLCAFTTTYVRRHKSQQKWDSQ